MKSVIPRHLAISGCIAVLAIVSSAQAQVFTDTNNPSCQDAIEICSIPSVIHELEISDVTTTAASKCVPDLDNPDLLICSQDDFSAALGVNFKVSWRLEPDAVLNGYVADVFDESPDVATELVELPGFDAVIAEGKSGSYVYCGPNMLSVEDIMAPPPNNSATPTKITACWAPANPCRLSPSEVEYACGEFRSFPSHTYLQAHRIAPEQQINICGCGGTDQVVQFGTPSGQAGPVTNVSNQGVATSGFQTCQRVVIGGRSMFIGDTCE